MAVDIKANDGRIDRRSTDFGADTDHPLLDELTPDLLRQLTNDRGIDSTTALLYDRLVCSASHAAAIERLNDLRSAEPNRHALAGVTCAVAPGAFYREFPHTGADGRVLREAAEGFGCRSELIPTVSTGTLQQNARTIIDWLAEQQSPVILASVSKGGSDIKTALAQKDAAAAFSRVIAWLNVGGILDGSPMVNWLLERPFRSTFYRTLFRWRGYNFDVIRDLRHGPDAPLDGPLWLPSKMQAIHVIGFPLTEHMTNRLSRTFRARIAPLGPNDGVILLGDAVRWPGVVYPVWGADHYLRPRWELRTLANALFAYVAESAGNVGLSPRFESKEEYKP